MAPNPKFDPKAKVFENIQISIHDLYRATVEAGDGVTLSGRTFRNCRFEGPALILVLPGTRFVRTSFGVDDIRSILFRPVHAQKAVGAIPVADCLFEQCAFGVVGFTGHPNFIDTMINELGRPQALGGNA